MEGVIEKETCRGLQIELLKHIHLICERENLSYYLAYGTLLGAIRHKGFIPWDDDIDICLERKDYEKLVDKLKKDDNPQFMLVDNHSIGYYYPFAKLVDSRTIAIMDGNVTSHGIWVDIFPLDNLPDKKVVASWFKFKCFFLRAMMLSMTTDFSSRKSHSDKKRFYKKILNFFAKIIGKETIARYQNQYIKKYNRIRTKNLSCFGTPYIFKEKIPQEEIKNRELLTFENNQFWGLKKWDEYLFQLYRDYRTLPPIKKRTSHNLTVFWKND